MKIITQWIQKHESSTKKRKRLEKQRLKELDLLERLTIQSENAQAEMKKLYSESSACESRIKEAFTVGDFDTQSDESSKRIEINRQYSYAQAEYHNIERERRYANNRLQRIEIELGLREPIKYFDYSSPETTRQN